MKDEDIEKLIAEHENDEHPDHSKDCDCAWCLGNKTASALRHLLNERHAGFEAAMDAELVANVRKLSADVFCGNCGFADDDLRVLAACAKWAVNNGIPDKICPAILPKAKAWQSGEKHLGRYGAEPEGKGLRGVLNRASPSSFEERDSATRTDQPDREEA